MSRMVRQDAPIERVETDVRAAEGRAVARGGDVAAAAAARLTPLFTVIAAARAVLDAAKAAVHTATNVWMAADVAARGAVGSTLDTMWNALGRPKQHEALDAVFPGGMALYTEAPRVHKPTVVQSLAARILAATESRWPEPLRAAWTAALDAVQGPLDAATSALDDAEGAFRVASTSFDTTVRRTARRALAAFKRDLKTLGYTEAQIGEIIPDERPHAPSVQPPAMPGAAPPSTSRAVASSPAPIALPPMSLSTPPPSSAPAASSVPDVDPDADLAA